MPGTTARHSSPTPTRSHQETTDASSSPAAAHWDENIGEFILDWDDVRAVQDPRAAALEFARSAFRHSCAICQWRPGLLASTEGSPPPVR